MTNNKKSQIGREGVFYLYRLALTLFAVTLVSVLVVCGVVKARKTILVSEKSASRVELSLSSDRISSIAAHAPGLQRALAALGSNEAGKNAHPASDSIKSRSISANRSFR